MKEIILCKYGEIILKGLNKSYFEKIMLKNITAKISKTGKYNVYSLQSTVYIEPLGEESDLELALEEVKKVFGIAKISRAAVCGKDIDDISRICGEYLPPLLAGKNSFKVESRRSDKRFPLTSPQISAEIGGRILEKNPHLSVDLFSPEIIINVEIRDRNAFVHAGSENGAGGIPTGTSGRALLLLSGGIDSPVAGYMMAKRGLNLDALHFESFPYTSEKAKEKVVSLAEIVSEYSGKIRFRAISLTAIQERLRERCDEEYFTLLLRRSMMRLAERVAARYGSGAIITGESLGQVASQTLQALNVTDSVVNLPVFRPCIGMDKEEITQIARKIGTFDTSILPYEDCCTIFTPRHPKTKPEIEKVLAQEEKADLQALEDEAYEKIEYREVSAG